MADDGQLAFILGSLTQPLKDYGRQRDDMNVSAAGGCHDGSAGRRSEPAILPV